jgi:hypothetical protein
LSFLRPILVVGLILTAAGFAPDLVGEYAGPMDYNGYLVFEYPEGENPITTIVFTIDPTLAGNLLILNVPSPWSHSYGSGVLTLSGGSLEEGGSVQVTVSLNKYFPADEYMISSVGTTSIGEESNALGSLTVGELYLLNALDLASTYRTPLTVMMLGTGFLDLFVLKPKKETDFEPVVDHLQPLYGYPVMSGRKYDDDILKFFDAEDAKWELNDADYARWKQLQDIDASNEWTSAMIKEAQLQGQLNTLVDDMMTQMGGNIGDFSDGVQKYSEALETLLRESTGIQNLYNEWNKAGGVKDMMWWADLADAVVGVAKLALNLGKGGAKLVVRLLGTADEAADGARAADGIVSGAAGADDALDAGSGASKAPSSNIAEANKIYDGKDLDEFEAGIEKLIGRPFDDYAEALPVAAQKLGYYLDFSSAEKNILLTLATKLRLAKNGKPVVFDANDLAWLNRMSQNPEFWENLQNAASLDIDYRMYRLVSPEEIGWLKELAGSPEAVNAAKNIPDSTPTLPPGNLWPGLSTGPPSTSGTVPYPGAITLPHGPPGSATVPFDGAITLPPPNSFQPGSATATFDGAITLPPPNPIKPGSATATFDGAITLPWGPPSGTTMIDGLDITIPPPRTIPMGGTTIAPPSGSPLDLVRPGDASISPTGLGGFSTPPPSDVPLDLGNAVDVVDTGIKTGSGATDGFQIKLDLEKLFGGDSP